MNQMDKKQQALMLAQKISDDIKQGEYLKNERQFNELLYTMEELQQVTVGIYIHQSHVQLVH